MKKKLLTVFCALFLVLGSAGFSGATLYWLPGVNETSGWVDADKTWTDDTLLCWAASASNLLAWTGWTGGPGLTTHDQIFSFFPPYWNDQVGNPRYAVEWWFAGTNAQQGVAGWAQLTDFSHSGFYPTLDYNTYWSRFEGWNSSKLINDFILKSLGISIRVGTAAGRGHFLTVWGWDDAEKTIYVTDSDSGNDVLASYTVSDTGGLSGGYSNWSITHIYGLQKNPGWAPIPEPSTVLLLAFGLMAIAWRVRAIRQK